MAHSKLRCTVSLAALSLAGAWMTAVLHAQEQPAGPASTDAAAALFDQVWSRFDAVYPYFVYKGIDWTDFANRHRPAFDAPLAPEAFAGELASALAELRDLHVSVQYPLGTWLDVYNPPVPLNYTPVPRNRYRMLAPYETLGAQAVWHTWFVGGVGYIRIDTFETASFAGVDEAAIDALFARYEAANGLIIDLRPNAGGNEAIALTFASYVADIPRVYGYVRYRSGPAHGDLGDAFSKMLDPAPAHRFTGPVVALIGPRNMSSAEWFALMLDVQPQVTLVGAPTRGATGNPEMLTLANGVTVGIPTWFALRPDGSPIEDNPIVPDVRVAPESSFDGAHDYVIERALELLGAAGPTPAP